MKKQNKVAWIDRGFFHQFIGMTTQKKVFKKELKRLGIKDDVPFITNGCNGSTHLFKSEKHGCIAIVCIERGKMKDVISLLVHEAVHVWQEELKWMNESQPGNEIEAYAIQYIVDCFYRDYKLGY